MKALIYTGPEKVIYTDASNPVPKPEETQPVSADVSATKRTSWVSPLPNQSHQILRSRREALKGSPLSLLGNVSPGEPDSIY